jgi:hypothetical protein
VSVVDAWLPTILSMSARFRRMYPNPVSTAAVALDTLIVPVDELSNPVTTDAPILPLTVDTP